MISQFKNPYEPINMPWNVITFITYRIHGTGIFPYILPLKTTIHVGKYTVRPLDGMGSAWAGPFRNCP